MLKTHRNGILSTSCALLPLALHFMSFSYFILFFFILFLQRYKSEAFKTAVIPKCVLVKRRESLRSIVALNFPDTLKEYEISAASSRGSFGECESFEQHFSLQFVWSLNVLLLRNCKWKLLNQQLPERKIPNPQWRTAKYSNNVPVNPRHSAFDFPISGPSITGPVVTANESTKEVKKVPKCHLTEFLNFCKFI